MRVSYNGYYMAFPRLEPEFDSLHPHQYGTWVEIDNGESIDEIIYSCSAIRPYADDAPFVVVVDIWSRFSRSGRVGHARHDFYCSTRFFIILFIAALLVPRHSSNTPERAISLGQHGFLYSYT